MIIVLSILILTVHISVFVKSVVVKFEMIPKAPQQMSHMAQIGLTGLQYMWQSLISALGMLFVTYIDTPPPIYGPWSICIKN